MCQRKNPLETTGASNKKILYKSCEQLIYKSYYFLSKLVNTLLSQLYPAVLYIKL